MEEISKSFLKEQVSASTDRAVEHAILVQQTSRNRDVRKLLHKGTLTVVQPANRSEVPCAILTAFSKVSLYSNSEKDNNLLWISMVKNQTCELQRLPALEFGPCTLDHGFVHRHLICLFSLLVVFFHNRAPFFSNILQFHHFLLSILKCMSDILFHLLRSSAHTTSLSTIILSMLLVTTFPAFLDPSTNFSIRFLYARARS